jgi:hypothetical protein
MYWIELAGHSAIKTYHQHGQDDADDHEQRDGQTTADETQRAACATTL